MLIAGCGAPPPARPSVVMREGTTVRTSCDDVAPAMLDLPDDPKPIGHVIERVCMYGASDESALLALKVGATLSGEDIRKSMVALAASPLVEDATIAAELRGDGALVHVVIKERPIVETVTGPAGVKEGEHLDRHGLTLTAKKLEADYADRGYGEAKVETSVEQGFDPKKVKVTLTVNEGPRWTIAKTIFIGIGKVPEAELRAKMEIEDGSVYNPDLVDVTAQRLEMFIADRGYLECVVEGPQRSVQNGAVTLTWTIREGELFSVGAIKGPRDAVAVMKLKPKATFDRGLFAADMKRVEDLYAKKKKEIDYDPHVDHKKKTVDVMITVVEK
jgi:outer membrane protein assembly factor BamA